MSHPYGPDHPNVHEFGEVESTPEVPIVYQEEISGGAIEVCVVEPVRTQEVPGHNGVARSITIPLDSTGAGIATPILGADPRRKRVLVLAEKPSASTSLCMFIGNRQATVQNTEAFRLQYGVPLVLSAVEELWATPQGTGLSGKHFLSIYSENWAD